MTFGQDGNDWKSFPTSTALDDYYSHVFPYTCATVPQPDSILLSSGQSFEIPNVNKTYTSRSLAERAWPYAHGLGHGAYIVLLRSSCC